MKLERDLHNRSAVRLAGVFLSSSGHIRFRVM